MTEEKKKKRESLDRNEKKKRGSLYYLSAGVVELRALESTEEK